MSTPVELSVKSDILSLIKDLEALNASAKRISETFQDTGKETTDSFQKQVKETETFLGKLRNMGRGIADQIKSDFKSLMSIEGLKSGLKLSEQFRGSVSEAIALGDKIRKVGSSFDIADNKRAKFQSNLIKGLGEIGLSSESATNTLEGLLGTPVKGEAALIEYAKTAGQLASITGKPGSEGGIAKGVAETIKAAGGNPNDIKQIGAVMTDVMKAYQETGVSPTEILSNMQHTFEGMASDFRKTIGTKGLAQMGVIEHAAGPGSTKFLEEYLKMSKIQRQALEAQGFKNVFTNQGLNIEQFRKASKAVLSRVGGDPRMAAKTLGLSDEAAEGFIRLANSLDHVKEAQDKVNDSTATLAKRYHESKGLSESFNASINRVKGLLSSPLAGIQEKLTEGLASASESNVGSAAVVLGGGALAAILAGGGLRGIGEGLRGTLKTEATSRTREFMTGKKAIDVFVVNANEIGGGGGVGEAAKGIGGISNTLGAGGAASVIGEVGVVATAGAVGYQIGDAINKYLISHEDKTSPTGEVEMNWVEKLAGLIMNGSEGADAAYRRANPESGFKGRPKQVIQVDIMKKGVLQETKSLPTGTPYR